MAAVTWAAAIWVVATCGGGIGGGHMGGVNRRRHMGGGFGGGHMGSGISPRAGAAFGAAHVAGVHGLHNGRHGRHRHFFVGGLDYGYYDNACWDWV